MALSSVLHCAFYPTVYSWPWCWLSFCHLWYRKKFLMPISPRGVSDWWLKTRFSDFSHLLIAEPTDQFPQAEDLRARGLPRPDGGDHGGLLLAPWALPLQWDPLLQCAGGLVGPLRDDQLPGAAVPAAAGGLQALPRLGGHGCPSGLSETGHRFVLGCAFLMIHRETHYIYKSCYWHISNACSS